jgi:hypothetical protein
LLIIVVCPSRNPGFFKASSLGKSSILTSPKSPVFVGILDDPNSSSNAEISSFVAVRDGSFVKTNIRPSLKLDFYYP